MGSISLTRSDTTLTVSWNAVDGAAKYHALYQADGAGDWLPPVPDYQNITATGFTFNVDNGKSYVVGVRAGNSAGWGPWTDSPASGPYTPVQQITVTATRGEDGDTAGVSWDAYAGDNFEHYRVIVCDDSQYNGASCVGTVWTGAPVWDANSTGPVSVPDLDPGTGYGVILQTWHNGSALKSHATLPAGPAAPTNLSVTPGDYYLDIAWNTVSGATGYDVRAKTAGSTSWHSVASNITTTSHRYTTSATIDYVAVRARNANGPGNWAELSRMPADDFMNVATGVSVAGASAQSGASVQSQLATPTLGAITRDYHRTDERIRVNWTGVSGAEGYNFACSQRGWDWSDCGWVDGTTVKYTSAPTGQTQPVAIAIFRRSASSPLPPGTYPLTSVRPYMVAVRAVKNNDPSAASPWTNSESLGPLFPFLRDYTYTRSSGGLRLQWTPNFFTTGYEIDCAEHDSTQPGNPSYTRCKTLTDQDDTASSHVVNISTWTAGGANYSINDNKTYDIRVCSTNKWGRACYLPPLARPISLDVSSVTTTTATLSISHYNGAWWYQRTVPSDTTCNSVTAGTQSVNLTSLTGGEAYSYTAYNDSTCTTALAPTATFITTSSVSNLNQVTDYVGATVNTGRSAASSFTTGDSSTGHTLHDVTVGILVITGNPGDLTVAVHEESGGNPAASTTYTLSGSNPSGPGNHTFTCSGTCQLSANTTYYLVLSAVGNTHRNSYSWDTTESATQANDPSGFGWSIGDTGQIHYSNSWYNQTGWTFRFKVTSTVNRTLTPSDITASGATLTIAGYTGNWYYKYTSPSGGTCSSAVSTTTTSVSDLTRDTAYTFAAYRDAGCTARLVTADSFTTLADVIVSASNLDEALGGLLTSLGPNAAYAQEFTTGNTTGAYKLTSLKMHFSAVISASAITVAIHDRQSNGTPADTARTTLTGTAANGQAEFTCTTNCELDANTSYFVHVSASSAAAAYPSYTTSDAQTLTPTRTGWSIADAARDEPNSWSELSTSGAMRISLTATVHPNLTASSVTTTTATLTIARHTGAWWYERTAPSGDTTCHRVAAGTTTANLSSLTASTSYTYKAYDQSGCNSADEIATATFTTPSS